MSPQKPFDLMVDDVIEVEIQNWLEDRDSGGTTVEAEQMEFEEEV